MSNTELLPLFPSATHPALPIAAQILSTLRNLTAPGKGNDLRPEERTALVGVSALIGCERVQSKDLVESSAQKASSVSPAHFRSALQHARRILRDLPEDSTSPTRRSGRSSAESSRKHTPSPSSSRKVRADPSAPSAEANGSASGAGAGAAGVDPLNPFQTPRKKYKHSSGVDVSGLMRSGSTTRGPHEPAMSSPLRHSVTPSKPRDRARHAGDAEAPSVIVNGDGVDRTPSKRVKVGLKKGVDLEAQVEELQELEPASSVSADMSHEDEGVRGTTGRKGEDMGAFFALRPGGQGGSTPVLDRRKRGVDVEDGTVGQRSIRKKTDRNEPRRWVRERGRRDWRYAEEVWVGAASEKENLHVLARLLGSEVINSVSEVDLEGILLRRGAMPVA